MVRSCVEETADGTVRAETRDCISSLPAEASRFAYAVRQHWGVESMHWTLDVTLHAFAVGKNPTALVFY